MRECFSSKACPPRFNAPLSCPIIAAHRLVPLAMGHPPRPMNSTSTHQRILAWYRPTLPKATINEDANSRVKCRRHTMSLTAADGRVGSATFGVWDTVVQAAEGCERCLGPRHSEDLATIGVEEVGKLQVPVDDVLMVHEVKAGERLVQEALDLADRKPLPHAVHQGPYV